MNPRDRKSLEQILKGYKIFIVIIIAILIGRLAWMQLVDVELYRTKAESNRMRLLNLPATRGNITTSDGVVLVTDHPSYQITMSYVAKSERENIVTTLVEIIDDPEFTAEKLNELIDNNVYRKYEPIVVKRDVNIDTVTKIEARRDELPGVNIVSAPTRTSLHDELASHVLGYIGEVSKKELENPDYSQYKMGDMIGKTGIEKQYDEHLRGRDGFLQVEVDANNRPIREIEKIDSVAGNNILLSLDYELQKVMEESFDQTLEELKKNPRSDKANAGAAVLLDAKTGEVLAMVSRPADRITNQNKAIQGRYIPGSSFKMVTAIAALEEGAITPRETIYNPGKYWHPPYIGTTAPIGHYNLYSAIAKSDNIYFQELGHRVGVDAIAKYGKELGLEGATGIDLPYENKAERPTEGLPTPEKQQQYFGWASSTVAKRYDKQLEDKTAYYDAIIAKETDPEKKKNLEKQKKRELNQIEAQKRTDVNWNSKWHAADTYNIAIGQGRQNYTPLQLAVYTAAIANGGTVFTPYLVKEIVDNEGNIIQEVDMKVRHQSDISEKTFKEVQKAMEATGQPGGTAYSLFRNFPKDIKVAAKTGTVQPGQAGYRVSGKQYYDGTFVAYAPADDPEIVFAGVVEFGYNGSGSAGKICKAVFEEYFGLNQDSVE